MPRLLILTAFAAALAVPALAQSAEDRRAVAAAIAAAGCRVDAANSAAILRAAGLSEDVAAAAVQALLDQGEAVIENGVLVLRSGPCS